MPWNLGWSESLKKRFCKYMLQRYLQVYLREKISFEQLSVEQLFNGTMSLTDLHLDVDTLNEIGENYNFPVEVVDGYIASISVSVPWLTILAESSYIEVQGLSITIQPKQRLDNGFMFDSTWSSTMATSIQLARECLQQDMGPDSETVNQSFEGLEIFAQTIDSVLRRIKVRFLDTVLRVEHVPKDSQHGVAVEFRFKKIDYFDEAGTEDYHSTNSQKNLYENAAFNNKKFYIEGFSFYTDEFPTHARTYARSVSSNDSVDSKKSLDLFTTAPVSPELPPQHTEFERPAEMGDMSNAPTNVAAIGPNPVLAGKFLGRQEIHLTLKQVDSVPGPKVATELSLNLCTLFLTPRQVHILLNLASGLLSPDMEDNSNVAPTKPSRNKPMEPVDFIRVEEELQKQMQPNTVGKSLEHRQGWSTHCLEDSDDDFLPMTTRRMISSISSDATTVSEATTNDDSNTSFISACGSSFNTEEFKYIPLSKDNAHSLNVGGSELTQFKIQVSNLNIFILHDDVMTSTADNSDLVAQSSVDQMKNTAEKFFIDFTELAQKGTKNFEASRKEFADICKFNHLRLSVCPLTLEGHERTVSSICTSLVTFACGSMELVECLMIDKSLKSDEDHLDSWEYCDLLVFDRKSESSHMDPCFRMKVSHAVSLRGIRRHRLNLPKTEVQIDLEQCHVELDISIVDRISDLLNPQPIYKQCQQRPTLCPQTAQACFNQVVEEGDVNSDYMVNVKIAAPLLSIYIRFPIPDLRALHDMDRLPWWKRNIRSDILQIDLTATVWSTVFNSKQTNSVIEVRWKDADGYYQAAANLPKIHFLHATAGAHGGSNETEFSCSRLLLKINPVKPPLVVEEDTDENFDSMPLSSIDTIVHQLSNNKHTEPSPFSSRKVVYENQHRDKHDYKDSFSDRDQMVMPGDKSEMSLFMETTSSNCRFHLDLTVPNWSACLINKDFYEVIYNRIVNDLFLWEPAAPKPRMTCDRSGNYLPNLNIPGMSSTVFHSFSPKLDLNADLDSNPNSDDEDHVYYSLYEQRKQKKHENPKQIGQNKVAVSIRTNHGRVTLFTPAREEKEKELSGYCGEIHLQVENGLCYILSGFQGQRNSSFICLQLNKGAIFHNGLHESPKDYPSLQNISNGDVGHLFPTVYHSPPGLYTKLSGGVGTGGDSLDMVTMAIKVNLDQNTNIKTFKVALGIREATLRYKMTPTLQCCIAQFADFFNVRDEFVAGYKEPDIVTELHLNLWGCAVDYRPINLPLRAVLTMESLCISSNITAHASISLLRFVGEDICLFLSQNCNATQVDLKKDYIEVIDINFCDLSKQDVTLPQEKDSSSDNVAKNLDIPNTDVRVTISGFNVRTCSDTFCALQDLIAYCTNYGDMVNTENKKSASDLLVTDENLKTHDEQVHNLMAEAMRESNFNPMGLDGAFMASPSRQEAAGATGEVFLFPDEAVQSFGKNNCCIDDPSSLTVPEDDTNTDSGDDSFLILEDDPGVGIMPLNGEPEVRLLTTEPITLIENYFAIPNTKTDQLKAPKDYPLPEERYTLHEMSITWHIYGGTDFKPVTQKKMQKDMKTDNRAFHDYSTLKVSFSPTTEAVDLSSSAMYSPNRSSTKQKRNWKLDGGPGRDHDKHIELQLSKVRFQYEKYPESELKAIWQILLIQDVEIRDRLASSQFNKFLYQYSSESVPRQTHANMVVIKSVHSRVMPFAPQLECDVRMSVLPIRLNIDQDALLFLFNFYCDIASQNTYSAEREKQQQPVMGIHSPLSSSPVDSEEFLNDRTQQTFNDSREDLASNSPNPQTFFRTFTFSPDVLIRLDYHGKHVDMEQGTLAGLIMGLGQLNNSEIRLKTLNNRLGILGAKKLINFAVSEWSQDIKKTQLPGLLGGVGPMHSLLQLIQGVRDLLWLPVEQYKRDGRIVRGIQRGANSFTTSTAMAVLELTNRLVQTIQCAAETAYDMVSSGPSVKKNRAIQSYNHKKPSQPADIREGLASACQVVKEGVSETARVLVNVASEEHRHKGIPGAVGGVLRQIPPTVVKPFIITAEATSNVLGGMRHQLQPDVRREAAEKWR